MVTLTGVLVPRWFTGKKKLFQQKEAPQRGSGDSRARGCREPSPTASADSGNRKAAVLASQLSHNRHRNTLHTLTEPSSSTGALKLQSFAPCHLQGLRTNTIPPTTRATAEEHFPQRSAKSGGQAGTRPCLPSGAPQGPGPCWTALEPRSPATRHLVDSRPGTSCPIHLTGSVQAAQGLSACASRTKAATCSTGPRAPQEDSGLAATCRQGAEARHWQLCAPCKPKQGCI